MTGSLVRRRFATWSGKRQRLPPAALGGRASDEVTLEDESTETAWAPRPRRRLPVDVLLIVGGALVAVASFAVTLAVLR